MIVSHCDFMCDPRPRALRHDHICSPNARKRTEPTQSVHTRSRPDRPHHENQLGERHDGPSLTPLIPPTATPSATCARAPVFWRRSGNRTKSDHLGGPQRAQRSPGLIIWAARRWPRCAATSLRAAASETWHACLRVRGGSPRAALASTPSTRNARPTRRSAERGARTTLPGG